MRIHENVASIKIKYISLDLISAHHISKRNVNQRPVLHNNLAYFLPISESLKPVITGTTYFFQSIWRQTRKQYRKRYYCCLETRSPTLHYPPPRTGTPTSSSIVLSNHSFERFARKDGNRQSQPSNDSSALTIETSNFRRRRARPTRMRRREFSDGTRSVPWNGSKRGSDNRRPSNSNTTAIGHCCRLISVYIVMGRV